MLGLFYLIITEKSHPHPLNKVAEGRTIPSIMSDGKDCGQDCAGGGTIISVADMQGFFISGSTDGGAEGNDGSLVEEGCLMGDVVWEMVDRR